jgi:multiple sugar transport system permease protein
MKHSGISHIAGRKGKDFLYFIALIAPALFLLSLVNLGPILQALNYSFREVGLLSPNRPFIGFQNYAKALADNVFWKALGNTAFYAIGSVAGQLVLAFTLASLLNLRIRGTVLFRVLALIPWITPLVVVGLLWRWMYSPAFGIINQVLLGLGIISQPMGWLGDLTLALPAVIIADIWKRTPLMMIMLLAGLQSVPVELYEAGKIDGTSWFSEFLYITLPSMKATIGVVTLLGIIWNIQQMVIVWLLTKGGPAHATETIVVYVYRNAFEFYDMGYASTVGIVMMVISLSLAIVYLRLIRDKS